MASKVEGVVDGGMHAEHALNDDVRQHGRGPVKLPLKRARRISTPIGSSCAARWIEVSEMTAYGATLSFPRVPAKVPSPPDLPTFVIVHCEPWFVEFTTLCSGQAA
jgi:hypothetical protein